MAGANPALIVRVAANLEELKRNLAEGKNQIETTTAAMVRLAGSFSGDRLIIQANNVVAAVSQIGGASRLTDAEQQRVNATLEKAIEKYRIFGKEAPAAMVQLADATRQMIPSANRLGDSVRTFDGLLASMGINLTPAVRGLGELGAASGKSAKELGMLTTAGLAVGAAIGGWKIGRAVAEFFDLDTKIANATAKLLGFGDVAGETAGAKADVLALATQRAGREITSFTEAMQINNDWVTKQKHEMASFVLELDRTKDTYLALTEAQREEIAAGDQLKKSSADIAKQIGVEEAVVRQAIDAMHDMAEAEQQAAEAQRKFAQGTADLLELGKGWQAILDEVDGTVVEAVKFYLDLGASTGTLKEQYALTDFQIRAIQESMRQLTQTTVEQKKATEEATKAEIDYGEVLKQIADEEQSRRDAAIAESRHGSTLSNGQVIPGGTYQLSKEKLEIDAANGNEWSGIMLGLLLEGYSFQQANAVATARLFHIREPQFNAVGPRVPGFAEGVTNFPGGMAIVGERGPEIVNLPRGSNVIPSGAGVTITVPITINGSVLSNKDEIARVVGDAFMQRLRGQGVRFPTGV